LVGPSRRFSNFYAEPRNFWTGAFNNL